MADSDDEYDRKRRDKFRGERSEYRESGGRRPPPSDDMRSRRDDWGERPPGSWDWGRGRGPPQRSIDYRLGGGHRVPHEFSPPNKRPRNDWDRYSHESYSSGYGSTYDPPAGHHGGPGGYGGGGGPASSHKEGTDGHPQLLSFKAWLSTQDDTISDQEALVKYAEYKQEFKRQQLNEFFVAHREEEWFKNKYHPDDSTKRKDEQLQNLKNRVNVFVEFLKDGRFDNVALDVAHADKLVKLMDWYVVRLEGGSNEDAARLLTEEHIMKTKIKPAKPVEEPEQKPEEKMEVEIEKAPEENGDKKKAKGEGDSSGCASDTDGESDGEGAKAKQRKLSTSSQDKPPKEGGDEEEGESAEPEEEKQEEEAAAATTTTKKKRKRSRSGADSDGSSGAESDEEEKGSDEEGDEEKAKGTKKKITPITAPASNKPEEEEEDEVEQLHRTSSIFLRSLAPTITKQEVESLCKKYPGFLRVAIADPQPDRRWLRRGWVTFKRNVNIKEICWNLNNVRLRDTDLSPIVNRDLSRRIRTVNGITPHKVIVRNDIRLAAKVIQHLDSKWKLWNEGEDDQQAPKESYGVYSSNPVLKNITDYLIEEASAEEEELLGMGQSSDGEDTGEVRDGSDKQNTIERDEELVRVLDRLLFYLRFVHSVDYYNHAEYPNEDDMPNRLGIMHGRGLPPASKVSMVELQEYNRNFEQKISTFFQPHISLTDEECKVLGMKDQETEVEKFITANTQELGKDKWLCPLSGKKFKGPEFVRKHILNKHGEKLDEVRKEVEFFNFYLRDPKRPQAPEAHNRSQDRGAAGGPPSLMPRREPLLAERDYPPPYPYGGGGGYSGGMGYGGAGGGGGGYGMPPRQPYQQPYREYMPRGRPPQYRTGGRDHGNRGIISYRDLDAPAEPDDF